MGNNRRVRMWHRDTFSFVLGCILLPPLIWFICGKILVNNPDSKIAFWILILSIGVFLLALVSLIIHFIRLRN